MTILDYLRDADLAWQLIWCPLIVGAALVLTSGVLSVLVVLKRLSFVGQGVSHSAFGGIGLAAVLGVAASVWFGVRPSDGGVFELAIVVVFCAISALLMNAVSDRKTVQIDTGIGILLVAAMALGGVLVDLASQWAQSAGLATGKRSWENILFGSMQVVGQQDVAISWGAAAIILLVLWLVRRPLLFWAMDEQAAGAFGVPVARVRAVLMVLLSVAVVVSMKLAGVVPASAMLVLPGAIALQFSQRLVPVIGLSVGAGLAGLVAAMAVSLTFNLQLGPCLVLVLTGAFFASLGAKHVRSATNRPANDPA